MGFWSSKQKKDLAKTQVIHSSVTNNADRKIPIQGQQSSSQPQQTSILHTFKEHRHSVPLSDVVTANVTWTDVLTFQETALVCQHLYQITAVRTGLDSK